MDKLKQIEIFILEDHSLIPESSSEESYDDIRLYKVVQKLFPSKAALSGKKIKSLISNNYVKVNNEIKTDVSYRVEIGDEIECEGVRIKIKNPDPLVEFNNLILDYLSSKSFMNPVKNIFQDHLLQEQKDFLIATFIRWETHNSEIKLDSSFKYNLQKFVDTNLELIYNKYKISTKDDFKVKIGIIKNLINENCIYLQRMIGDFKSFQQINSFKQQIKMHISRPEFKLFIRPFIPPQFLKDDLDIVISYMQNLEKVTEKTEKNLIVKKISIFINERILLATEYDLEYLKEFVIPLYNAILNMLNEEIFGRESLKTDISIEKIEKKYPFSRGGDIELQLKVRNVGGGFASNVKIVVDSSEVNFVKNEYILGDFLPGDRILPILVSPNSSKNLSTPNLEFIISWNNLDGTKQIKTFRISFDTQTQMINWDKLRSKKPYSLSAIDNKDKLLGRDELLDELVYNFQGNNIDSFILYGQRRVGKTSIVKSLMNWFNNLTNSNLIFIYVDCTNQRSSSSTKSIENLGSDICFQLQKRILNQVGNSIIATGINNLAIPKFEDTLSPLKVFLDEVNQLVPGYKFIIGIDEFDELQYEVYKPGELSETLFRNLRGLNNSFPNLGFILVGSEKMPKIYNWHGEQLNNWKNRAVDTFDRILQYSEYKKIIEAPVYNFIKFSDEAISEIYEFSSGNPYFTNVICSWVFDLCYQRRDAEVTKIDVHKAIELFLSKEAKTSFQHFWLDGILDSTENKDIKSDMRRRTLLALSLTLKMDENYDTLPVTEESIINNFNPPPLTLKNICKQELDEFQTRNILYKQDNSYMVSPKLFQVWLIKYGQKEIVTGISDLEEFVKNQEIENSLKITQNEISQLIKKFSFNDKPYSEAQFRNWLEQFGKNSNQRLIFQLLSITKVVTEDELKRQIRDSGQQFFNAIVQQKRTNAAKRSDTIVTYFNLGAEDNLIFAQKSTEVLSILKENIGKIDNLLRKIDDSIKLILIIHPLLYEEEQVFLEIDELFSSFSEAGISNLPTIRLINLYSDENILKSLKGKFSASKHKIEVHSLNNYNLTQSTIFDANYIKLESSQKQKIKDLLLKFFPSFPLRLSQDIVFDFCHPQFSLPIFWYPKVGFKPLYEPAQKIYIYSSSGKYDNNIKAKQIGDSLERKMLEVVLIILEKSYGNEWWIKSVPDKIRKKCMTRWDDENRIGAEHNYLDFIDYSELAKSNECLREYFFYDKSKNNTMQISKDKGTIWLSKLNDLRKIYSHPTRNINISDDDLNYLEMMNNWFNENLAIRKFKSE